MGSDSAESGDGSNPQNGDNGDQITEPLLACLQKITMYSDGSENGNDDCNSKNGKFNKDQIKELITCVLKIIKILNQSLKKNTKHKERNLIKKRTRAKNAKVYNSHDVIRELCNTIKNIGCSVSNNDKQAEGPSLAKVVAGTFRSQIPAVAGTSRSNIEAIPGTSRGHTEAILGTYRSHMEAIPVTSSSHAEAIQGSSRSHVQAILGTSRGHTAVPARTGKSTNHTIPVVDTRRGNTDVDGTETPKSQAPALAGNCRNHIAVVPITSRSNEAIPGKSRSDTDVTALNSRRHVKVTDGALRILADTIPGASRSHINGVPGAYGSLTDAVPGLTRTSRRDTEEIAGTSGKHSVTAATEKSYNVTIAAVETSRKQTESIAGTSRGNTELTEVMPGNSKNHTETTAKTLRCDTEPAVTEKIVSRNGVVTEASKSHTEAGLNETPKGSTHRYSGTPINHTEPELIRVRSIMFWPPASHTKPILGSPRSDNEKMVEASKNLQNDLGNTSGYPKPDLADHLKSVFPKNQRTTEVSVLQTLRSQRETVDEISSKTEPIVAETRKSTIETLTSHTKPVVSSRTHTEVIPVTSGSQTEAITVTSRSQTDRNHARTTETSINHTKNLNPETSVTRFEASIDRLISRDRAVTEAPRSHTEVGRTETPRSLTHTDSGTAKKDTEETAGQGYSRSTVPELRARSMFPEILSPLTREISPEIPVDLEPRKLKRKRKRNSSLVKITDITYDSIAEPTQELVPDIPLTHEISLDIPMDVESRRLKRKRKRNSALVKITDMDIIRNQVVAGKITARTESSPNRHIEQGSAISSLNKITNTHKDNKSTDDSKRKLTENCALNGRTEETITNSTPTIIADADKSKNAEDVKKRNILKVIDKPDSTKSPNEQTTSNSTPVKTTENDKENKSVDENKRKTKAKDSAHNAHVEHEITKSTLTNDKQASDAKKKTASRSDNSDSMPNERMEETTSNSTLTKMTHKKKAEELMNGKKRKKIEKDYGSQKNTYSTIDLTSGNDFDEPKAPTSAFQKGNLGPAKEDKKIKNEQIIYISDDTCFYNPAEEKNQGMKVIQEPVPKPEDIDQVLKDQQVIDVDEDTCLYDLAQEESTITNSGSKSRNHNEISKDEQVIDLSEDTCLYEASQQKTSGENKKCSPKKECDDEIMNFEQATNSTNSIQEICRSEGENVSATNLEPNKETKHRTELLEEREVKCAEYLLATNVKKEQASKDPGSSNTVVISSFFHAPPNQNNQKPNHKSSEQNTTHIKQRLQGNCNSLKKLHDKVTHASKRSYKESKNDKNKLKPDKVVPEVTITTKTPDSCVQKSIRPSSERHTSDVPVNKPELSITELSKPKRPLTHSAIESILLQAAQIALPNLSITTSTASSEYRTSTMETPSAKLNPVTPKRHSTDSRQSTKRDDTKPGGQQTNPVQMNANIHQNVLLPSDPSVSLSLIMQNIAKLDCRPNATSNSSAQYRSTESRSGKPKPINTTGPRQFSKRNTPRKSSKHLTDYFEKKARTVPQETVSETSSTAIQQRAQITKPDSSNFTNTATESLQEKPKPITKAATRPTTNSGQFSKGNIRTKSSEQPTDSFEKKALNVPPGTVSETSSSAIQQRAQITKPDSSNFTSMSAESRSEKPKPVTTASKRPSSESRPLPKTNTGAKPSEQPTDSFEKKARTVPPATISETSSPAIQQRAQITKPDVNFTSTSAESLPEKPKPITTASKRPSSDPRPLPKTNTGAKPKQQKANPIQNGQINPAAASSEWRPASLRILLSPSQHHNSGNTISLSTNGLDFATGQSTNPNSVPNSQSTSYAAQESPKLASSRPKVHSALTQNSNSIRRETISNNVQSQIDWYTPVPLENLTPDRNSQNLNAKRKSSTKNHSYPIPSWHTPVLSGNEPGLPQTASNLPSSSHQSSLPHHLRLQPLMQEQPAYQGIPTGRPMADAVRQLNPPMRALLVPRNQAAMMDNQKATVPPQPTWHIPTEATDI